MTGSRKPAASATSVNLAWKGRPEGLPRGCGRTPRDAIPCAPAASGDAHVASHARRVYFVIGILREYYELRCEPPSFWHFGRTVDPGRGAYRFGDLTSDCTWGSQSWQPPFEGAPRSTTETDLVLQRRDFSHEPKAAAAAA